MGLFESDKSTETILKKLQKEGKDFLDSGNFDEALDCFNLLLTINSKNKNALKGKGMASYELGKVDDALDCFKRVLEIDPKAADIIRSIGALLYKLGKISIKEAHTYHDRALEIDPEDVLNWSSRGALFADAKKFNESKTCFDRALEIDPEDIGSLFGKGSILKKIDRMKEAKTCFERALKISEKQKNKKYRQKIKQVLDQINEEERGKSKYKISPNKLHHNYYEILGISKNATQKEIKTRFNELMLKFHPDKESSSLSKDMTLKIVEAYNTLRDIEKRKQYDLKMK